MDVLSLPFDRIHVSRTVGGYSEVTARLFSTARVGPLAADRITAGILTPEEEGEKLSK